MPAPIPTPPPELSSVFGYPVKTAKELGLEEFFKTRPEVAGMAWGGGENDSELTSPRSLVSNPYNQTQSNPLQKAGLFMIEAARHKMGAEKYQPTFPLSGEQQTWRKGLGEYATDDKAFKQSILSRLLVGDTVPGITARQQVEADTLSKGLWEQDAAAGNPLQKYLQALSK